ncbi:hypothetical protein Aph02nite_48390 [Actinoplanes philippinensis]|uniref:Uncharacterized protein n=1 Tax=Actinoplanes philippinensis TaxID=35752 RepID=A0A1I2HXF1_9ACTN|nr:hypothetical protein [Actinoplanes philippinensis]GIE78889.1 hypothetical protein Aph02nite_48390 [Actinoplanes philippinensis]SFF34532.1 hypothetical protein SAMN05421541_10948 [Actinoplanes philippinensis]
MRALILIGSLAGGALLLTPGPARAADPPPLPIVGDYSEYDYLTWPYPDPDDPCPDRWPDPLGPTDPWMDLTDPWG